MKKITDNELLELYNDTLNKCGIFLLNQNDYIIEYNIYEDFDIGINTFFHVDNLKRLYDSELINLDKLNKSILLREKVIELQKLEEWQFEYFKTSDKWKEIMILCDEIRTN